MGTKKVTKSETVLNLLDQQDFIKANMALVIWTEVEADILSKTIFYQNPMVSDVEKLLQ